MDKSRRNDLCNNLFKIYQDEHFRIWSSIFKMVEIGKLYWLSVIWNCCQSFGWLYLAVLNVVKLFCSLFLLWHKWQCIALVNNRVLVWFNWLLNRILSATHMGKGREVAVEVSVFHLPCPALYFHMCEQEIEHFIWHSPLQIKFVVKLKKTPDCLTKPYFLFLNKNKQSKLVFL